MSGKTEWEDALIAHGIMAAPEPEPDMDEIFAEEQEQREQEAINDPYKHLYGKSLDELREHEDDVEEDAMEALRKRRLAEMKKQAMRNKFGRVFNISENQWKEEVTDFEKDVYVIVHLYARGREECVLVDEIFRTLAAKFKDVKFVRIEGRDAIRNYPDELCPTVLVYLGGQVKLQLAGINAMGGMKCSANTMEWTLSKLGAIKTELTEDPFKSEMRTKFNRLEKNRKDFEDEGDSWLDD